MILSKPQAEAVYSAMCALNNVGGRISAQMGVSYVAENVDGEVCVEQGRGARDGCERYDNKAAFATAYGLNSDEPQSAVAAAAGGLTQTAIER